MGDWDDYYGHEPRPWSVSAGPGGRRRPKPGELADGVCADCGRSIRCDQLGEVGPAGRWRLRYPSALEKRVAAFSERHPEIVVWAAQQRAAWIDDRGVQEVRYGNVSDLIDYLTARFDR